MGGERYGAAFALSVVLVKGASAGKIFLPELQGEASRALSLMAENGAIHSFTFCVGYSLFSRSPFSPAHAFKHSLIS